MVQIQFRDQFSGVPYKRSFEIMMENPPPECNGAINQGTVQKWSTMADRKFQSFDFPDFPVLVFLAAFSVQCFFAKLAGDVLLPV